MRNGSIACKPPSADLHLSGVGHFARATRCTSELVEMSTTTKSIASVLNFIIETCKDGQEGFRSAAEDVKSADIKELFSELSMQRQQFADELQTLVLGLGEEAQTSGSFSGVLHHGWMDLKAAITNGDEHTILVECERGEDAAVAAYSDALEHEQLPSNVHYVIKRQYMGVQAAQHRVRELRVRLQS